MEENNQELKGGHPPAQKVGGMRVVQHKTPKDDKEATPSKMTPEDIEEFGTDKPEKKSAAASSDVVISGAKLTAEEAFPTQAVKSFHDKPMPTHDKGANHKPKIIQQPKK